MDTSKVYIFDPVVPCKGVLDYYFDRYMQQLQLPYSLQELQQYAETNPFELIRTIHIKQLMTFHYTNKQLYKYKDPATNIQEIYDRIIRRGKGGLCWELNSCFRLALDTIGFRTKLIMCQQLTKKSRFDQNTDHLVIDLNLSNKELAKYFCEHDPHTAVIVNDQLFCDLGFGKYFINPLVLPSSFTEPDYVDNLKIVKKENYYYVTIRTPDRVKVFLRFTLCDRQLTELFKLGRWYSTDPNSLWSIWTTRLYESRLIRMTDKYKYQVNIYKKTVSTRAKL